jgi:flavodoxin I
MVIFMKTLIIYDSVYGNTEKIARAIGRGFESPDEVELIQAGDARPWRWSGLSFLVIGSPTQRFNSTRPVHDLLKSIPRDGLKGIRVAAFDTRLSLGDIELGVERLAVKTGGYAARGIARSLQKHGASLVVPPEGFIVKGMEGPLLEGEEERATGWANKIRSMPL